MRLLPKGAWGEHGAWAMALTSLGAGLVLAGPPVLASWLMVPAVVLLTAAKGMAQRVRRSGEGFGPCFAFTAAGLLFALPAAVAAPDAFLPVAAVAVPFGAIYAWNSDSPRFTRSLPVEMLGTCLVAAGGPLAVAGARPTALTDAALAWLAMGTLFLPGVFRARVRKDPSAALRTVTAASACAGIAAWGALAWGGFMAPWGLVAATVFLGDLWSVGALPKWGVKTLGIFFSVRYAAAALLMALAWRTVP